MAKVDTFGNPVPMTAQGDAARSNLFGAGYSEEQVNKMLGSATADQLGLWSSNQGINPADPVTSTDIIRDNIAGVKTDASKALGDIAESGSILNEILKSYDVDVGQPGGQIASQESELQEMARSLGILTPQEEAQVKAEGESAYSQYLPIIQEAEEGKRRGLPKATIGAGERGGFMSTQFAGGAALRPTEGGDFFGEGGLLNQVKSDYDRNILLAKSEAQRARLVAEAAARQAIKTGKRQDYEIMERAVERTKQLSRDIISLNQTKADAIYQYSQFQQNAVQFRNSLADRDRAIELEDQDRIIAAEDRARELASNQFNSALNFLGIDGIKSNQTQLENMFKEAGFTDIKFSDVIAQFEAEAEAAELANLPKPELRTVGNQLLAVTFNQDTQEFETKVLATSKTGGGGGGSDSSITKDEEKFYDEIEKGLEDLRSGANWGEVWNRLKAKWGAPDDVLDSLLNKEVWAKEGAFSEFKDMTE